eukprot:RCo023605
MQTKSLRVLCYGAGAIGTYIGVSLAHCGYSVGFLEMPSAAEELRSKGLTLDFGVYAGELGSPIHLDASRVKLFTSLEEAVRGGTEGSPTFDVLLFALKSFDTERAMEEMRSLKGLLPPVLCLQNGVENEDKLATVLGADRVIAD